MLKKSELALVGISLLFLAAVLLVSRGCDSISTHFDKIRYDRTSGILSARFVQKEAGKVEISLLEIPTLPDEQAALAKLAEPGKVMQTPKGWGRAFVPTTETAGIAGGQTDLSLQVGPVKLLSLKGGIRAGCTYILMAYTPQSGTAMLDWGLASQDVTSILFSTLSRPYQ